MDLSYPRRPVCAALAQALSAIVAGPRIGERGFGVPRASQRTSIRKLLPLGAMLAGVTLAPQSLAQVAPDARPELKAASTDVTLPEVPVKDARERTKTGYQGGTTNVGKTQQLPKDIPASVSIIPESLIRDQNDATLTDALRNAPGITFAAGEGGRIGDNITMRGFSLVGDLYLDAIRDVAQYTREVFNLEQIDIFRGSASMLFGRGSTGGVVNQTTKMPFRMNAYEAAFTYGTDDYKRLTADMNQVVDENTAIRFNALYHDADSFRGDGPHYRRWGVAPAVTWGLGTRNEFSLAYYYLDVDNVPDFGVPYFQGRPLDVPVDRFYGFANGAYEKYKTSIGTATYIHRFTPLTSLKTVARYARYERDLWSSVPRLVGGTTEISDSTVINRQRQARGGDETPFVIQSDLNSRFMAGGFNHLVIAGIEYANENAKRWSYEPTGTIPPTTVGRPDPYPNLPAGFFNRVRAGEVDYKSNAVGIYAQDIVDLTPAWKLMLGLRWDLLDAEYQRAAPLGPLDRTERVWSYRTGLIYQPSDTQTYYAAYGTSFNPSAELYSLDVRGTNTPPEESFNAELGAKWELFDGNLSLRTAIYRTEKTNERNTDPLVADQFLLSGRRHTDGIEVEMAGRLTPNWEIFAGATVMRARIDESVNANDVGKWPLYAPPYTANLWTVYNFGRGFRVGGGFNAVGKRYGNVQNTNVAPAYVRWDAMASYEQKHWLVRVNLINAFNETYHDAVYAGHVIPGSSRAVQATLELRY